MLRKGFDLHLAITHSPRIKGTVDTIDALGHRGAAIHCQHSCDDMVCLLVQCQPTQKIWMKTLKGSCWEPQVLVRLTQFLGGQSLETSVMSDGSDKLIINQPCLFSSTGRSLLFRSRSSRTYTSTRKNKIILCPLVGLGIMSVSQSFVQDVSMLTKTSIFSTAVFAIVRTVYLIPYFNEKDPTCETSIQYQDLSPTDHFFRYQCNFLIWAGYVQ